MKKFFTGAYGPDSIGLLTLDEEGNLSHRVLAAQEGASYLFYKKDKQLLYAISRGSDPGKKLHVYRFDGEKTQLLSQSEQAAPGACHLDVSDDWLVTAYYKGGAADIFAVHDGIPEPKPSFTIRHSGGGPMPQQDDAHIHWVRINKSSPEQLNFYLIDLGGDSFCEYELSRSPESGKPDIRLKQIVDFPPGTGPRHAYVDETHHKIYVLSELSSRLFVLEKGNKNDSLVISEPSYPLRGQERSAESWGGAIKADDSGTLLFCSNRGDETIRCFTLADRPEPWEVAHSAHAHCRDLQYARVGEHEYLLLANMHSSCISVMAIDRAERKLRELPSYLEINSPSCIIPLD